jgi:Protein of unknown function (DUF3712)
MVMTNPTPDSFHLVQDAVVESSTSFHPRFESFNLSLFLEDTEPHIIPFAILTTPSVVAGTSTPLHIEQDVLIQNKSEFTRFSKLMINSETLRLGARGDPVLHEGGLPVRKFHFNKAPQLQGLNGLKGSRMSHFEILSKPQADGTNFLASLYIPNPSIVTLEMVCILFIDIHIT